jgi:hypothetical protein
MQLLRRGCILGRYPGLRSESLDNWTLGVLSVRIAVGSQAGELLAQLNKLSDADIHETQLGRGELPRGVA